MKINFKDILIALPAILLRIAHVIKHLFCDLFNCEGDADDAKS